MGKNGNYRSLLIGDESSLTIGFAGFGILLGIGLSLLVAVLGHPISTWLTTLGGAVLGLTLLGVLSGVSAYQNTGLLLSIWLIFWPIFGIVSLGVGVGTVGSAHTGLYLTTALGYGLLLSAVLGGFAFLSGVALRRITERERQ